MAATGLAIQSAVDLLLLTPNPLLPTVYLAILTAIAIALTTQFVNDPNMVYPNLAKNKADLSKFERFLCIF